MNTRRRFSLFLSAAVFGLSFVALNLRADDMYVWAEETLGVVTFYFQGSIDLIDFPNSSTPPVSGFIRAVDGTYISNGVNSGTAPADAYSSVMPGTIAQAFGTSETIFCDSSAGDMFGFTASSIVLPVNYASGTQISGSMTFDGHSFITLEVDPTPKSFDTTVGTNTIHMFTMPPAVPQPPDVPVLADNSVVKTALLAKIKKAKKKVKAAKKKGQTAKAKKLNKKVKKLKAQLKALG